MIDEKIDITQINFSEPEPAQTEPLPVSEPVAGNDPAPQNDPLPDLNLAATDFNTQFKERVGGKYEKVEDVLSQLSQYEAKAKLLDDPFLATLADKYHQGEDLTPYLRAKTVNYDTMSLEDLAELHIRQKYPNASKEILAGLYDEEIIKGFGLGDDDNALGKFKFETEMGKVKESLKAEQAKYLEPTERLSPTKEAEDRLRQEIEAFNQLVDSDPTVKSLRTDNKIAVKHGDESVYVGVDKADDLVEMAKDTSRFFSLFKKEDGQIDLEKFMRVAAFANNPAAYDAALIAFGKTKATEVMVDKLQNPAIESNRAPETGSPATLLQAFGQKLGTYTN